MADSERHWIVREGRGGRLIAEGPRVPRDPKSGEREVVVVAKPDKGEVTVSLSREECGGRGEIIMHGEPFDGSPAIGQSEPIECPGCPECDESGGQPARKAADQPPEIAAARQFVSYFSELIAGELGDETIVTRLSEKCGDLNLRDLLALNGEKD